MRHFLTFDIEDWFDVPFVRPYLGDRSDSEQPTVVVEGTRRILALLDRHNVKSTFFVVGKVAERHPELIAEIATKGHEIATHGQAHVTVDSMTREEFAHDLAESLRYIERACGVMPKGYRAPLGSLDPDTLWVLDELTKAGLDYDSSIYPKHPLVYGGVPGCPAEPYRTDNGLWEYPLSVGKLAGVPFPISGGFYLRFLPFPFFRALLRNHEFAGNRFVLYYHSWEFVTDYPRPIPFGWKRFVQYYGLETVETKLDRLLNEFSFGPFREAKASLAPAAPRREAPALELPT